MSSTKLEIINQALAYVGTSPLYDGDTNETAETFYDCTLEAMLEEYQWNFAVKTDCITEIKEEICDCAYHHIYELPKDVLRLIAVGRDLDCNHCCSKGYDCKGDGWEVQCIEDCDGCEKQVIMSNDGPELKLQYIKRPNESSMSKLFIKAFALHLAYEMNRKEAANTQLGEMLRRDMELTLRKAKKIDAKQSNRKARRNSHMGLTTGRYLHHGTSY